jgi:hypothetical protein
MKPHIMLFGSLVLSNLPSLEALAAATDIDPNHQYAWYNAGFINFNPAHGGVKVCPDHLEGYAWGNKIGWIQLGSHNSAESNCDSHPYNNSSSTDWGINRQKGNKEDKEDKLVGFAWSKNVSWINFAPPTKNCNNCPSPVTINSTTGEFKGYAWSANIGWIHLGSPYGGV